MTPLFCILSIVNPRHALLPYSRLSLCFVSTRFTVHPVTFQDLQTVPLCMVDSSSHCSTESSHCIFQVLDAPAMD
uniref:Uncharacterized protein n=1 Tax=Picea sitchensis TaxID=3332 RepID=A9P1U5_PICSI|nr:unknown [Picea sitchensis]